MLLGKRSRPEIRRTTSMTGISFDLTNGSEAAQEHSDNAVVGPEGQTSSYFLSMLSPRTPRRSSSGDFIEPAHFLRTCGLCKRRLASGRDIYMYRGDTAFCSLECREQQMKQDERKEGGHASTSTTSSKSSSANKSQTVAAA